MIALDENVLAWLRDSLGVQVGLYEYPSDEGSAAFSPSPVHEAVRAYRAGGGIYGYTYEVRYRVRPRDASGRMDAAAVLAALCAAVDARSFPEAPEGCAWLGHETTQRPGLFEEYDDGREVYRAVFRITYIELS